MDAGARRQIVFDVLADLGNGMQTLQRNLTREEAVQARKLFQDVELRPRIVLDPDLERNDRESA
jgi:hypothetical protein